MSIEPDAARHWIFPSFAKALEAWQQMQDDPEIDAETKAKILPPRQSHRGLWIFDRIEPT